MLKSSPLGLAMPALALGLVGLTPSIGQSADFFAGKTITVVVPSGSGGTFQVYGQLV